MRVLELSLRNYRVFEEVDLELPARVIGIFGTNGSGKTTLCEAILFALYGRTRTDKKQIRTHGILTDCVVRVVFEHGGAQYEVRRTIKGKGHQTEAELFVGDRQLAAGVTEVDEEIRRLLRMDQQVFRASVFAEQKQLDAFSDVTKGKRKEMVLRLLGIRPVDDARTAARAAAREAKAGAERLGASLPDVSEQETALAEARAVAEEAEERARAATVALGEAEARTKTAEEAFAEADRVRERAEKIAVQLETLERQATESDERRRDLAARVEGLKADLEELPALKEEHVGLAEAPKRLAAGQRAVEVADEVRGLEAELAALPELDAQSALAELKDAQEELQKAQRAHSRAEATVERTGDELAAAEAALENASTADPSQPCPTCGRPLGDDFAEYLSHCKKAVATSSKNAKAADRDLRGAVAALKAADQRFTEAQKTGGAVQESIQRMTGIEAQLAKGRSRLESFIESFGGSVPDLEALEADARRAEALGTRLAELKTETKRLAEAEADLAAVVSAVTTCRSRIDELSREAAALAFDKEDHDRLRKERDEALRLLEQAREEAREATGAVSAVRETVVRLEGAIDQAKKTAAKVDELREEARYVERVSLLLDGFRNHLVARIGPELSREAEALFRELTNHEYEDLKINEDDLAIEIADGGMWFPIERFSGSEVDLANLALRVAISAHLSRMSGADVGMMVLDEVLGSLDAERKDLMVQSLGRLSSRFHQLFVITHAEQVKDQFPATVEVRKTGRRRSEAVLVG